MSDPIPPYVFIVGPSCSGKTSLSIDIAKDLNSGIINCDSVQVYQKVNIGTAKPTEEERAQVPHHLFDVVQPGRKYSAANYLNDVMELVSQDDSKPWVFCGGSGFYVQALEKGLYPNVSSSQEVKDEVWTYIDQKGFAGAYQWIKEKDEKCAEMISPNDHYRIRRSMEIMLSQNLSVTELKKKMEAEAECPLPRHHRLKIGLIGEREELLPRVQQRTKSMLEAGFIDEVQSLIDQGFADWAPLSSVGYKEVALFLSGQLDESELEERINTATMQLIKKQKTWFRRDKEVKWFSLDEKSQARDCARTWVESRID